MVLLEITMVLWLGALALEFFCRNMFYGSTAGPDYLNGILILAVLTLYICSCIWFVKWYQNNNEETRGRLVKGLILNLLACALNFAFFCINGTSFDLAVEIASDAPAKFLIAIIMLTIQMSTLCYCLNLTRRYVEAKESGEDDYSEEEGSDAEDQVQINGSN